MAIRHADAPVRSLASLVCSPERPAEAEDLTDAERAAIAVADPMVTDHFPIDDSTFDRLREQVGEAQIMEFCINEGLLTNALQAARVQRRVPAGLRAGQRCDIVDTAVTRIDRITERGIVIDGVEHELDCIIFATGFELGTTCAHQAGYDIVVGDARISDEWAEGMQTYHGVLCPWVPESLLPQGWRRRATLSVPQMLQEQVTHMTHVFATACARGRRGSRQRLRRSRAGRTSPPRRTWSDARGTQENAEAPSGPASSNRLPSSSRCWRRGARAATSPVSAQLTSARLPARSRRARRAIAHLCVSVGPS